MRVLIILAMLVAPASAVADPGALDAAAAGRFVQLAQDCVHVEYPNKIAHVMASDEDVRPPRVLTPAFYGCYDWHSAVHGHWLLARAISRFPDAEFAVPARTALEESLTVANLETELAYLRGPGRTSFERPYGLAWLLQLAAELGHPASLAALEAEVARRLAAWLPKLRYPIRTGEHNQTAFALGLVWDWSVSAGRDDIRLLVESRARDFYLSDRACPLHYEPSGEDFLSPCLAEADLMRRVLDGSAYASWLSGFLSQLPDDGGTGWLPVAVVTDRSDPKLAHIDGLNLSRAWMLAGIAAALPEADPRRASLLASRAEHRDAALPAVTGEHYEGGHWLGTFAFYLETGGE